MLAFTSSCKKSEPEKEQPGKVSNPVLKPKGASKGSAVSRTIDASGGELSSTDGRITVIVPAGAVSNATAFAIEPITNTLTDEPSATAYRLTPEGTNFSKPITLVFSYTEEELNGKAEEGLSVAYQHSNGSWKNVPTSLHKNENKLTVSTNHFSDWSFYSRLSLRKDKEEVSADEQVNLDIMCQTSITLPPGEPGSNTEGDLGANQPIVTGEIKNWKKLSGPGKLTVINNINGKPGKAVYTAPSEITSETEVEIQVEVEGVEPVIDPNEPSGVRYTGKVILLTTIRLVPDSYVKCELGGEPFEMTGASTAVSDGRLSAITSTGNGASLSISLNGAKEGSYPCGAPEEAGKSAVHFVIDGNPAKLYHSAYYDCGAEESAYSNGSVFITKLGAVGDYIEGRFTGTVYHLEEGCDYESRQLKVDFRVKREQ